MAIADEAGPIFRELAQRVDDLTAQASGKLRELKDGIPEEQIRRIETEHDAIISQLGDASRELREAQHEHLREIGAAHGCEDLIEQSIRAGLPERKISERVLAELVNRQERQGGPQRGRHNIEASSMGYGDQQSFDNPNFRRQAVEDALYSRLSGRAPEGAAKELRGRTLLELDDISSGSRSYLEPGGYSAVRGGGMTTSDLPALTLAAGQRYLQERYEIARSPVFEIAREMSATDFRSINILRLSEAPQLAAVNEAGEITRGAMGEEKEAFSLKTFARIFALSRQVIVNDDLSSFGDALGAFGRAAAETANGQLVGLLTANSGNGVNLADGQPLFTTARGNKAGTASVIDVGNLHIARKALRDAKGIDGVTPLSMTPKFLLVSSTKETEGESVLSTLVANQLSAVNPFSGRLTLLVEPRLSGNSWRVFADNSQQSCLRFAYLKGRSGPELSQRPGWDTLGVEFRAVLDFGCGATDWRGCFLNAGA